MTKGENTGQKNRMQNIMARGVAPEQCADEMDGSDVELSHRAPSYNQWVWDVSL